MHSINRRRFLQRGALGLAAIGLAARGDFSLEADPLGLPVGLQLYTVRFELKKDFDGTLKKVADIGYKEVEGGFQPHSPSEVRASLAAVGLAAPSCHFDYATIRTDWERSVAYGKDLGLGYMVCSFLPPNVRKSLDDYRRVADVFNQAGSECQKAGIQFCYHNHNFEFQKFGDVMGYDELLRSADQNLVKMQLDCYWMSRAGHDPVAYFKQYPGRFPLLHIKDMKPGHAPTSDIRQGGDAFTEVGRGSIDWKRIFEAAPEGGIKHYFVEQDVCADPVFECARISYEYLHNLQV